MCTGLLLITQCLVYITSKLHVNWPNRIFLQYIEPVLDRDNHINLQLNEMMWDISINI